MTRDPNIKSIDCTSCGAGLEIFGGGRVLTHICPYCGSALDALDSYKAVAKFSETKRLDSPFQIGATGNIMGVAYTVIGTLGMKERYRGTTWGWVDHQIYSPTHGYAYLTYENGHFVFTRKLRESSWMSSDWVERSETPPTVNIDGQNYKYYETSESTIYFAEGEFNWRPHSGYTQTTVSVLSRDAMVSFSETETETEREIERSIYLPYRETLNAFGIEFDKKPIGVHPVQPYIPRKNEMFLKVACACFAVACCMIGLFYSTQNGAPVETPHWLKVTNSPILVPLEITTPKRLAELKLSGNVDNSWAFFEMSLTDPEGDDLFIAGREIEYYHGRDKDGAWTEGNGTTTIRFWPLTAGTYTLEIERPELGIWSQNGKLLTQVKIGMREGMSSGFWSYVAGLFFVMISGYFVARELLHHKLRWRGTDWTDDD